jgi:hypothetical protein
MLTKSIAFYGVAYSPSFPNANALSRITLLVYIILFLLATAQGSK